MIVTKEHAAIAQLETAIWLYFEDVDPISDHSLANAAGEALDGCCQAAGQQSMWSYLKSCIRTEHRKELNDLIKAPYIFFKHQTNADKPIDFADYQNLLFLFRAALNSRFVGIDSHYCSVFMTWLAAIEPLWLAHLPDPNGAIEAAYGDVQHLSREDQKARGRLMIELAGRSFRS